MSERTWSQSAADALADEVAVLVRRRIIDSRSPAADALLDYRDPPSTPRADRLAEVEAERDRLREEVARWEERYRAQAEAMADAERALALDAGADMRRAEVRTLRERVRVLEGALERSRESEHARFCDSGGIAHTPACDRMRAALRPASPDVTPETQVSCDFPGCEEPAESGGPGLCVRHAAQVDDYLRPASPDGREGEASQCLKCGRPERGFCPECQP